MCVVLIQFVDWFNFPTVKTTQRASAIDIKDAVYADIKQPTTVNVIPMEACDAYGVLKATGPWEAIVILKYYIPVLNILLIIRTS